MIMKQIKALLVIVRLCAILSIVLLVALLDNIDTPVRLLLITYTLIAVFTTKEISRINNVRLR